MKLFQSKIRKLLPYIVIIGLWLIFCFPYFIKGLVPFPSNYLVSFFPPWNASYAMPVKNNAMPDIITQIYPWKKFTIDTWKKGEIPLWNPNSFGGTAHAANYQSAVFSPFNSLFFSLPFIDAWSILILLQPLLAGLFIVLYLREIGCKDTSSIIGGVGFMFSGFLVTWMAYGTLGYAVLFLPFTLWSIEKYIKKKSWKFICLGALSISMSFLSGHFQISVYVLLASLLYIFFSSYINKSWKIGFILTLMIVIGVCLASVQLFLTYDAFILSVRMSNTSLKEVIPWQYLITFFAPDFYGNPVTRNDWFGHYAEWAGYIGIVPFLLSIYSLLYANSKKKIFFSLLGISSILFAYSSPLSTAIFAWKIPVLSTSAASRIIILASFSLCVLSALGFDQLMVDWKKSEWKKKVFFGVGILIFLCVVWIVVYIMRPFEMERLIVAKRNLLLPTLFVCITISIMYAGFIKQFKNKIIYLALLLVCMSLFDSYRYASKWMPFDAKEFVYPTVKFITFLSNELGTGRVFGNVGNDVGSYFNIPLIEGYDAMYQGRYGEFINATSNGVISQPGRSVVQFDRNGRYALQVFQLLGVKYILHRISDGRNSWVFPHWLYPDTFISRYRDEHYEIFEFKDTYPRVFLASSYVIKKDKQQIIDVLFQKDFDRRNTLILEDRIPFDPEAGEGSIEIQSVTPNSLIIKANVQVPKLLYRSESYDAGWHVTIDDKPTVLYRADYDFQAVLIPKGEHLIKFTYWPKSMTYGIFVMCFGLGLLLIIVGVQSIKRNDI